MIISAINIWRKYGGTLNDGSGNYLNWYTTAPETSNQSNQTVSQLAPADINQAAPQIRSQANQTNSTYDSSDLLMKERLLNYTNDAILALNDDNETAIQQNLVQIQNTLIKAIGKPVVIVPAPAFDLDSN